ncbi:MAG: alpha/beta fold hydrolase [Aquabacterium sp.]
MRIEIEPGVRLYVDIDGAGLVPDGPRMRQKPTLIALHGGPGFDHSSFKPAFSALTDIAQVVYVDHRGHGRSDRAPVETLTLDRLADDIVLLCAALGIERPVVLGQSYGGFVAQRYLARHPAHPGRVVLSSTSHHLGLERKVAMFERLGGPQARDIARAFWTTPDAQTWAAYEVACSPLYNTRRAANDDAKRRSIRELEILFAFGRGEHPRMNLRPGLATVQCPVLVLSGDADPVTPVEDGEEITAAIPAPHGQFVRIADAGHGTWRDQPEPAMAALRAFIQAAG